MRLVIACITISILIKLIQIQFERIYKHSGTCLFDLMELQIYKMKIRNKRWRIKYTLKIIFIIFFKEMGSCNLKIILINYPFETKNRNKMSDNNSFF